MTKKCVGCGSLLQSNDKSSKGYIREDKLEDSIYCENCFKLLHYGKLPNINREVDYKKVISNINKTNYPVLFVIDILNLNEENLKYLSLIKNKKYILLSKFDILPNGIKEGKIIEYFKNNFINADEVYCVSGVNNYNIEKILKVLKEKKYKNIFISGLTNAGKSTLLNAFLRLNRERSLITTSSIPNTTLENIYVNINGINFIDTPGFKYEVSLYNELEYSKLLKILPKKELRIKTIQVNDGDSILVEDIFRIDYKGEKNSLNFYMNNRIQYKKFKTKNKRYLCNLNSKEYELEGKKDIVISGLGFVKLNKKGNIKIYINNLNLISIRDKMI